MTLFRIVSVLHTTFYLSKEQGATTFTIMAFAIMDLIATLSITTLGVSIRCHYPEYRIVVLLC